MIHLHLWSIQQVFLFLIILSLQVASYGGLLKFGLQYSTAQDAGNTYFDVDVELAVSPLLHFQCAEFFYNKTNAFRHIINKLRHYHLFID